MGFAATAVTSQSRCRHWLVESAPSPANRLPCLKQQAETMGLARSVQLPHYPTLDLDVGRKCVYPPSFR